MSIKNAYKLKALITTKFSKERCNSLVVEKGYLELHEGMTEGGVGPLQPTKHIFPK